MSAMGGKRTFGNVERPRCVIYGTRMERITFLVASLALAVSSLSSCNRAKDGLRADFGVSLDCARALRSADEITIEKSLYSAGFDVLNRSRLARELRVEFSPPVRIDAIDQQGRILSVTGFADTSPTQHQQANFNLDFSLYTRPPTSRDRKVETDLERVAAGIPMCSVRKVDRSVNPASVEWLYTDLAKTIRGWFAQARREAPGSDAHRVHQGR